MPTFRPPRREPRLLAVAITRAGIAFAVADPWEVRSAGTVASTARARRLVLVRLVRREKPTAIVAEGRAIRRLAAAVGRELGLAVVPPPLPTLPIRTARDLYPELPIHAPTSALERLAVLAIAAVLNAEPTSRLYAKSLDRKPAA